MKRILTVLFLVQTIIGMAQIKVTSGRLQLFENFKSEFVTARSISVWLPDNYSEKNKYAVLYMHDGQMLFDPETTWNKQAWKIDETAGKLQAEKKTQPFIVVGIWNSGMQRHNNYFPQKPFESLSKTLQDSLYAIDKGKLFGGRVDSDNYLKFLVSELKPFIDKNFSTYKDQQHTFIAGSSMGGLISLYAICEYPDIFGGAACLSTHWPGIFTVDNSIPNAFFDYMEKKLPSPENHKLYFDYGDQTLDAMYPALQQKADMILKQKGFTSENWLTKFFPGDDHSEKAWKERVHFPLEFLLSN